MSGIGNNENNSERDFEFAAKWLPSLALLCFAIFLFVYFYRPGNELGSNNDFGTFGDFLGGALNPILGFATVWLLIQSIRFQIHELRLTRIAMSTNTQVVKETKDLHAKNLHKQEIMFITEQIICELEAAQIVMIEINDKNVGSELRPATFFKTYSNYLTLQDSFRKNTKGLNVRICFASLKYLIIRLESLCENIIKQPIRKDLIKLRLLNINFSLDEIGVSMISAIENITFGIMDIDGVQLGQEQKSCFEEMHELALSCSRKIKFINDTQTPNPD